MKVSGIYYCCVFSNWTTKYPTCENFDFVVIRSRLLNQSHKIFCSLLCCEFYQYEIVWIDWIGNAVHFIFAVCKFVGPVGGKIWIISVEVCFIQCRDICLDRLSKVLGLAVSYHQQDPEHVPNQESDSEFLIFSSTVHHFYLVWDNLLDMEDLFSTRLLFQRATYLCLWWFCQAL